MTSGSNSTGPSKSNSAGPSLTTPLNALETQPNSTIENTSILIPAPETVPPSPAVPIKVMPKSVSPLPVPREPGSTEHVGHGSGPESTNVDVTITIPEIAVTTTCSDQEDVTVVTENKC